MKIVHFCPFFNDGWTYQENYITKYHKVLGNDVCVLTSCFVYDDAGNMVKSDNLDYRNEDGVRIIRMECNSDADDRLRKYIGLYECLDEENPDILFIHGCQFMDAATVAKWLKKHSNVTVYVDNHADFSNSATNWLSKNILHKILWRHMAHLLEPYTKKFYGVLPARVEFLQNVYKLPKEKCELLLMGADDELVRKADNPEEIKDLRKKYNVSEDEFLIVTGGKIDLFKTQTLLLMEAVKGMKDVKLLIFGSVVPEMKEKFDSLCGDNVIYIGWIDAKDSYKYFAACDFAVFPGRHSVFWEQVAAQAKPMIVKYWEGTTHVDIGGNVKFLYNDSVSEIKEEIEDVKADFEFMKDAAASAAKNFLYSDIAKRSIE